MLSSVMKTMKWCVWEGIIFNYEKNPGMQTYMIDKNEELQPEPQEKYEESGCERFSQNNCR